MRKSLLLFAVLLVALICASVSENNDVEESDSIAAVESLGE